MYFHKIKDLEAKIVRWKYLYYNNTPEVSDAEYDAAEQELTRLKPASHALHVGYPVKEGEPHIWPMLSMQKALTQDVLKKWFDNNNNHGVSLTASHKIDGLAIELIYMSGVLVKAITRGDGLKGEDVTKNILFIKDIPHYLMDTIPYLIVRGEVYMSKSVFNKVKGAEHTDPRNLAVGSLKCDDVKVTEARQLSFFAYKACTNTKYFPFENYVEELKFLSYLNFPTVPYCTMTSYSEVIKYFKMLETGRTLLDYKVDGMVVCLNDSKRNEHMGHTDHHPRYSICLKFEAEAATTTVRRIDWSMSRNGTLTPVAVFDPVVLAGATITCAKAHNISFLTENNINIGNSITIVRSGDVIPKIVAGDTEANKVNVVCDSIPNQCPYCNSKAVIAKEVNTYTLRCTNNDCWKRTSLKLEHFLKEVGVKGVGEAILDTAVKSKYNITTLKRLYTPEFLLSFDSYVIAKKIHEQLNASRGCSAIDFMAGLGIPEFSRNSVTKWLQSDDTITAETIKNFPTPSVKRVVGEAAYKVIQAYCTPEVLTEIMELISIVCPVFLTLSHKIKSNKLAGARFCVTGTLSKPRSAMIEMLQEHGAVIVDSVSSHTNYLLAGEKAGSKKDKAVKLGVKILSEADLEAILE
jgi:DNA ligase (NAD+)